MTDLNIISRNCNGISNKIKELTASIKQHSISIVVLDETCLNSNSSLTISNFHVYQSDQSPNLKHPQFEGTVILIHQEMVHHSIAIPTTLDSTTNHIKLGHNITRVTKT